MAPPVDVIPLRKRLNTPAADEAVPPSSPSSPRTLGPQGAAPAAHGPLLPSSNGDDNLWTPEEDAVLLETVRPRTFHGSTLWTSVAQSMVRRGIPHARDLRVCRRRAEHLIRRRRRGRRTEPEGEQLVWTEEADAVVMHAVQEMHGRVQWASVTQRLQATGIRKNVEEVKIRYEYLAAKQNIEGCTNVDGTSRSDDGDVQSTAVRVGSAKGDSARPCQGNDADYDSSPVPDEEDVISPKLTNEPSPVTTKTPLLFPVCDVVSASPVVAGSQMSPLRKRPRSESSTGLGTPPIAVRSKAISKNTQRNDRSPISVSLHVDGADEHGEKNSSIDKNDHHNDNSVQRTPKRPRTVACEETWSNPSEEVVEDGLMSTVEAPLEDVTKLFGADESSGKVCGEQDISMSDSVIEHNCSDNPPENVAIVEADESPNGNYNGNLSLEEGQAVDHDPAAIREPIDLRKVTHRYASSVDCLPTDDRYRSRWAGEEDTLLIECLVRRKRSSSLLASAWQNVALWMTTKGFPRTPNSCAVRALKLCNGPNAPEMPLPLPEMPASATVPRHRSRSTFEFRSWTEEEEYVLLSCLARKAFDRGNWNDLLAWMNEGGYPRSESACVQRTAKLRANAKCEGVLWSDILKQHYDSVIGDRSHDGADENEDDEAPLRTQDREDEVVPTVTAKISSEAQEPGTGEFGLCASARGEDLNARQNLTRIDTVGQIANGSVKEVKDVGVVVGKKLVAIPKDRDEMTSKVHDLENAEIGGLNLAGSENLSAPCARTAVIANKYRFGAEEDVAMEDVALRQNIAQEELAEAAPSCERECSGLIAPPLKEANGSVVPTETMVKATNHEVSSVVNATGREQSTSAVMHPKPQSSPERPVILCGATASNKQWTKEEDQVLMKCMRRRKGFRGEWVNVSNWMSELSCRRSHRACKDRAARLRAGMGDEAWILALKSEGDVGDVGLDGVESSGNRSAPEEPSSSETVCLSPESQEGPEGASSTDTAGSPLSGQIARTAPPQTVEKAVSADVTVGSAEKKVDLIAPECSNAGKKGVVLPTEVEAVIESATDDKTNVSNTNIQEDLQEGNGQTAAFVQRTKDMNGNSTEQSAQLDGQSETDGRAKGVGFVNTSVAEGLREQGTDVEANSRRPKRQPRGPSGTAVEGAKVSRAGPRRRRYQRAGVQAGTDGTGGMLGSSSDQEVDSESEGDADWQPSSGGSTPVRAVHRSRRLSMAASRRSSAVLPGNERSRIPKGNVGMKLRHRKALYRDMQELRTAAIRRGVPVRPRPTDVENPHSASFGLESQLFDRLPLHRGLPTRRREVVPDSSCGAASSRSRRKPASPAVASNAPGTLRPWLAEEDKMLLRLVARRATSGGGWSDVVEWLEHEGFSRTERAVQQRAKKLEKDAVGDGKVWADVLSEVGKRDRSQMGASPGKEKLPSWGEEESEELKNCWYASLSESEGSMSDRECVAPLGDMRLSPREGARA